MFSIKKRPRQISIKPTPETATGSAAETSGVAALPEPDGLAPPPVAKRKRVMNTASASASASCSASASASGAKSANDAKQETTKNNALLKYLNAGKKVQPIKDEKEAKANAQQEGAQAAFIFMSISPIVLATKKTVWGHHLKVCEPIFKEAFHGKSRELVAAARKLGIKQARELYNSNSSQCFDGSIVKVQVIEIEGQNVTLDYIVDAYNECFAKELVDCKAKLLNVETMQAREEKIKAAEIAEKQKFLDAMTIGAQHFLSNEDEIKFARTHALFQTIENKISPIFADECFKRYEGEIKIAEAFLQDLTQQAEHAAFDISENEHKKQITQKFNQSIYKDRKVFKERCIQKCNQIFLTKQQQLLAEAKKQGKKIGVIDECKDSKTAELKLQDRKVTYQLIIDTYGIATKKMREHYQGALKKASLTVKRLAAEIEAPLTRTHEVFAEIAKIFTEIESDLESPPGSNLVIQMQQEFDRLRQHYLNQVIAIAKSNCKGLIDKNPNNTLEISELAPLSVDGHLITAKSILDVYQAECRKHLNEHNKSLIVKKAEHDALELLEQKVIFPVHRLKTLSIGDCKVTEVSMVSLYHTTRKNKFTDWKALLTVTLDAAKKLAATDEKAPELAHAIFRQCSAFNHPRLNQFFLTECKSLYANQFCYLQSRAIEFARLAGQEAASREIRFIDVESFLIDAVLVTNPLLIMTYNSKARAAWIHACNLLQEFTIEARQQSVKLTPEKNPKNFDQKCADCLELKNFLLEKYNVKLKIYAQIIHSVREMSLTHKIFSVEIFIKIYPIYRNVAELNERDFQELCSTTFVQCRGFINSHLLTWDHLIKEDVSNAQLNRMTEAKMLGGDAFALGFKTVIESQQRAFLQGKADTLNYILINQSAFLNSAQAPILSAEPVCVLDGKHITDPQIVKIYCEARQQECARLWGISRDLINKTKVLAVTNIHPPIITDAIFVKVKGQIDPKFLELCVNECTRIFQQQQQKCLDDASKIADRVCAELIAKISDKIISVSELPSLSIDGQLTTAKNILDIYQQRCQKILDEHNHALIIKKAEYDALELLKQQASLPLPRLKSLMIGESRVTKKSTLDLYHSTRKNRFTDWQALLTATQDAAKKMAATDESPPTLTHPIFSECCALKHVRLHHFFLETCKNAYVSQYNYWVSKAKESARLAGQDSIKNGKTIAAVKYFLIENMVVVNPLLIKIYNDEIQAIYQKTSRLVAEIIVEARQESVKLNPEKIPVNIDQKCSDHLGLKDFLLEKYSAKLEIYCKIIHGVREIALTYEHFSVEIFVHIYPGYKNLAELNEGDFLSSCRSIFEKSRSFVNTHLLKWESLMNQNLDKRHSKRLVDEAAILGGDAFALGFKTILESQQRAFSQGKSDALNYILINQSAFLNSVQAPILSAEPVCVLDGKHITDPQIVKIYCKARQQECARLWEISRDLINKTKVLAVTNIHPPIITDAIFVKVKGQIDPKFLELCVNECTRIFQHQQQKLLDDSSKIADRVCAELIAKSSDKVISVSELPPLSINGELITAKNIFDIYRQRCQKILDEHNHALIIKKAEDDALELLAHPLPKLKSLIIGECRITKKSMQDLYYSTRKKRFTDWQALLTVTQDAAKKMAATDENPPELMHPLFNDCREFKHTGLQQFLLTESTKAYTNQYKAIETKATELARSIALEAIKKDSRVEEIGSFTIDGMHVTNPLLIIAFNSKAQAIWINATNLIQNFITEAKQQSVSLKPEIKPVDFEQRCMGCLELKDFLLEKYTKTLNYHSQVINCVRKMSLRQANFNLEALLKDFPALENDLGFQRLCLGIFTECREFISANFLECNLLINGIVDNKHLNDLVNAAEILGGKDFAANFKSLWEGKLSTAQLYSSSSSIFAPSILDAPTTTQSLFREFGIFDDRKDFSF